MSNDHNDDIDDTNDDYNNNTSDDSDTSFNFHEDPPLHIVDHNPDSYPFFHTSPLHQSHSSLEDAD